MRSDVRQADAFPRGTTIRNHRQLSLVDAGEPAVIAAALGIAAVEPGLLPTTSAPRAYPKPPPCPGWRGWCSTECAVIMLGGENLPCVIAGRMVAAAHGTAPEALPKAASRRRGVTGWVEHPGVIRPGAGIRIVMP